jgi:hypothetical protein
MPDGRDSSRQTSPSLESRRSLEQGQDQTWQERIIYVVLSILRILERQSYLLSLLAMLVNSKHYLSFYTRNQLLFRHGVSHIIVY